MNIEKQIYYNTEELQERMLREKKLVVCFGSGNRYGGLRISVKRNTNVSFSIEFESLSNLATFRLDDALVAKSSKTHSHIALRLEKGEHVFEIDAGTTHGAFKIEAEGVGIEEGHLYIDRVGGYFDDQNTVVYLRNGDGFATKNQYTDALVKTETNYRYYDEAYLYDKTNAVYAATKRYIYSYDGAKLYVIVGRTLTLTTQKLNGAAICDARTLEDGADYIVAYINHNGELVFMRTVEGERYNSSHYSAAFPGFERVVSAQRGSIIMAENKDHVWSAYYFHPNGEKELVFSRNTFHYDEIRLCRNRHCSPTATIDETTGEPIFYYKQEDGKLMKLVYGSTPTLWSYEEAFHPGSTGGLCQFEGELRSYAD